MDKIRSHVHTIARSLGHLSAAANIFDDTGIGTDEFRQGFHDAARDGMDALNAIIDRFKEVSNEPPAH